MTLGEVRRKTSAAQSRGYSVEGWKVLDRADGRQGRDALQQAAPRLADMLHLEGMQSSVTSINSRTSAPAVPAPMPKRPQSEKGQWNESME